MKAGILLSTIAIALLSIKDVTASAQQQTQPLIQVTLRQCQGMRTRRDLRDLTQNERNRFFEGIKRLAADGRFKTIAQKHGAGAGGFWSFGHASPMFLPLHRAYLREFEDLLRDAIGDQNFALPYWDWSRDSQAPGRSVIFTADFLGANDPNDGYHIADGPFAGDEFPAPGQRIVRQYNKENMTTFHHSSILAGILDPNRAYSDMCSDLELGPHATVHTGIGGKTGNLTTRLSSYDPIFWLHHCFVDKLWYDWQAQDGNLNKFDGRKYGAKFANIQLSDIIVPYQIPVSSIMRSHDLCVQYAQPRTNGTDVNITSIKPPDSLPDAFFNNTGINRTQVEDVANRTNNIADQANRNLTNGFPIAKLPTAPALNVRKLVNAASTTSFIRTGFNILLASAIYLVL